MFGVHITLHLPFVVNCVNFENLNKNLRHQIPNDFHNKNSISHNCAHFSNRMHSNRALVICLANIFAIAIAEFPPLYGSAVISQIELSMRSDTEQQHTCIATRRHKHIAMRGAYKINRKSYKPSSNLSVINFCSTLFLSLVVALFFQSLSLPHSLSLGAHSQFIFKNRLTKSPEYQLNAERIFQKLIKALRARVKLVEHQLN